MHLNCMKSIKILVFLRLIGLCHSQTDCFQATMQILVCVCLSLYFAAKPEKLPEIAAKLMISGVVHNFEDFVLKRWSIYLLFGSCKSASGLV